VSALPASGLRARFHAAAILTGLSLVFSVSSPAGAASEAKAPAPARQPINVILITIDTLRADHVGCYGAKQVQTPAIDALCHDGIVFEHAFSQVPLTWPSHAAILTGTYPFQNGVQDFTGQPLSPRFRNVAEAFKQNGYATGAVVSSFVLDRSWGLARGFDFYDDAFSAEAFKSRDIGLVDRTANESVNHAITWLEKASSQKASPPKGPARGVRTKPFFLWLHLYDPHSPYSPPEPYRTQYKDRPYDGEIAYADHELGRLISWLKEHRLYDQSVLVFLSDHGESLGEHGEAEHGFFIYNSTIEIPLIVKPPAGQAVRRKQIQTAVESVSISPTLLELAHLKDPIQKQFQTASLLSGETNAGAYSETFYPFSSFGWSPLHSIETGRYHYIEAPDPELYDVVNDPGETNNVASQQSAVVAVLKDKLQRRMKINPFGAPDEAHSGLSSDTIERLRALGYVAYRAPVSAAALKAGLPDPKAKLEEFNAILKANDEFRAGNFQEGEALLSAIQQKDPQMYVIPFMLGEAASRQGKWEQASVELKKSLDLNPNLDQAMTALAKALASLGQTAEAKHWIESALRFNPQNFRAWYDLGRIESKPDPVAAVAAYEKSIAIQPNFALARRDLGLLLYEQRNYAEASQQLCKAVELGTQEAPVYNFLGISYSRINQLPKAVKAYQEALTIDPNMAQAHLNLGYAYTRMGKADLAKAEYKTACRLEAKYCSLAAEHPTN